MLISRLEKLHSLTCLVESKFCFSTGKAADSLVGIDKGTFAEFTMGLGVVVRDIHHRRAPRKSRSQANNDLDMSVLFAACGKSAPW